MWGMMDSRPRWCLKIGVHAMTWGEHTRSWGGRHRYRCAHSPTPHGSVKLSPVDPNVVNRALIEERLRSLAGPSPRLEIAGRTILANLPRSITLVIPDLAVRAMVVVLDHLPPRREEQEALIRWRLGQDQRVSMTGAKLFWQIFPPHDGGQASSIVFVIAAQDQVLAQYESICESVGLIPQRVGVSSLYLFNLWLRSVGGQKRVPGDLLWVTISDGGLTCFVVHGGRPVFARTKLLSFEGGAQEEAALGNSIDRIIHGIEVSLLACQEHHPGIRARHLILATENDFPGLDDLLSGELGVAVNRLEWGHVDALGCSPEGRSHSTVVFPVIAGLI